MPDKNDIPRISILELFFVSVGSLFICLFEELLFPRPLRIWKAQGIGGTCLEIYRPVDFFLHRELKRDYHGKTEKIL